MAAVRLLFLLVTLFFYFGCLVCDQSLRDEDEIIHNVALNARRDVSRRNVENSLRISLVYLELEPLRLHVSVVKKLLSEAIQYFHDTFRVRQTVERIILDRRCLNDSYFLKNATGDGPGKVRFCKVACDASKPLCGPRNVPRSDVAACRVCNEHGEDCHAENNSSSGVGKNDTDFVLYVAASMEKCEKRETLAYAA
ncbi:predicted protein, partial [Nematostella vectensis]